MVKPQIVKPSEIQLQVSIRMCSSSNLQLHASDPTLNSWMGKYVTEGHRVHQGQELQPNVTK